MPIASTANVRTQAVVRIAFPPRLSVLTPIPYDRRLAKAARHHSPPVVGVGSGYDTLRQDSLALVYRSDEISMHIGGRVG